MDIVIGPTLRPETRPTKHRDIPSPPALVRERKGRDSTGWTITKAYKRLVGVYDGLTESQDFMESLVDSMTGLTKAEKRKWEKMTIQDQLQFVWDNADLS